jgi:hypothetical protein
MDARIVELSDCWSLEHPATYYRIAALRARRLQADATTPKVKQYLDNMITHCEALAGKGEPSVSPASGRRYAGSTRMARNHHRLRLGSRKSSREEGAALRGKGWMRLDRVLSLPEREKLRREAGLTDGDLSGWQGRRSPGSS